jgi:hypothetical protein
MRIATATVLLFLAFPLAARACFEDPQAKGVVHGVVLRENGEPVPNFTAVLEMLGVSLGYMLPTMKTNERGEFRFEHLCPGRFAVVVENAAEGYPPSGAGWYRILYGGPIPEVRITKSKSDAELIVTLPPKPAELQVNLFNSKTKEKIPLTELSFTVNPSRTVETYCDTTKSRSCDGPPYFLFPPDQNVILHVTSTGFHEWKESAGRGKLVRVGYGELLTLNIELDPVEPKRSHGVQ